MTRLQARQLTAPGTAAIMAVRFEGADAAAFLAARLARSGSGLQVAAAVGGESVLPRPGRHRRLTWRDETGALDDVIVVALPAGAGGGFEVHGHGGAAGAGLWRAAVEQAGGEWQETGLPQQVLGDALQALESEAGWRLDFARVWRRVETETQAAVVAASQAAILAAWRAQPDRRQWPQAWLREWIGGAEARIPRLLMRRRVLLSGPVNAGKSTLLNALLADRRALTSAQPGTTRDLITGRIELAGLAVDLIDSAGLRPLTDRPAAADALARADQLEQQGMALTTAVQAQANCTLWLSPTDAPAAPPADWQNVIVVRSKADLQARPGLGAGAGAGPGATPTAEVAFSAQTGVGLADLTARLGERLLPAADRAGAFEPGVCSLEQWAAVGAWLR